MRTARSVALLLLLWPAASAIADAPLAGYSDKNFYLKDGNDLFVLVPKGRINVDWYNFLNRPDSSTLAPGVQPNGAADPRNAVRDGVFIRRARVGFAGTLARYFDFRVEGEFAQVATAGQYATLADASVVVNFTDYLQLEAGQFYAPFTLENQTSENFVDFMEKAATVRFVVPSPRDTGGMLLGEAPLKLARYQLGVFNGDGQNTRNLDNRPALIGRLLVQPLGPWSKESPWLANLWVGGSLWWQEATNLGGAAPPSGNGPAQGDLAALTTQGGFPVFNGNYAGGTDAMGNPIRAHLAPDGTTVKYAFEISVPITWRFGLRAEYVHQSIELRRYDDLTVGGAVTRAMGAPGRLDGWATYAEAYAWIGGPVNTDFPGRYALPHWRGYVVPPPPRWALQLAARYEHVELDVSGLASPTGAKDPAAGHYGLDVFALGANMWFTRHARVMANYLLNYIGAGDRLAPLQQANLFVKYGSHVEHELLFRLQVNL